MELWIKEFFFSNAVGIMLSTVKNPDSQLKFKRAFLKVYRSIAAAYAGDSDFD